MNFKLESVLSLKKNIEQNKKRELFKVHQKKVQLQQEVDHLQNNLKNEIILSKEKAKTHLVPQDMIQTGNYLKYVQSKINSKEEQKRQVDEEINEKRKDLVESVKERKILENLKQVHQNKWYEEQKKEEQSIVDQLVSYQYSARNKGEQDG